LRKFGKKRKIFDERKNRYLGKSRRLFWGIEMLATAAYQATLDEWRATINHQNTAAHPLAKNFGLLWYTPWPYPVRRRCIEDHTLGIKGLPIRVFSDRRTFAVSGDSDFGWIGTYRLHAVRVGRPCHSTTARKYQPK
jgi:hypothetical protein